MTNSLSPYGYRHSKLNLEQRPVKDEAETSSEGTYDSDFRGLTAEEAKLTNAAPGTGHHHGDTSMGGNIGEGGHDHAGGDRSHTHQPFQRQPKFGPNGPADYGKMDSPGAKVDNHKAADGSTDHHKKGGSHVGGQPVDDPGPTYVSPSGDKFHDTDEDLDDEDDDESTCKDCGEPTSKNGYGDKICVNGKCFAGQNESGADFPRREEPELDRQHSEYDDPPGDDDDEGDDYDYREAEQDDEREDDKRDGTGDYSDDDDDYSDEDAEDEANSAELFDGPPGMTQDEDDEDFDPPMNARTGHPQAGAEDPNDEDYGDHGDDKQDAGGEPCADCGKPTGKNGYGDSVCTNKDCFAGRNEGAGVSAAQGFTNKSHGGSAAQIALAASLDIVRKFSAGPSAVALADGEPAFTDKRSVAYQRQGVAQRQADAKRPVSEFQDDSGFSKDAPNVFRDDSPYGGGGGAGRASSSQGGGMGAPRQTQAPVSRPQVGQGMGGRRAGQPSGAMNPKRTISYAEDTD